MKKFLFLSIIISLGLLSASPVSAIGNLAGKILLQVEENGEAWYVYPKTNSRYYLGRPQDAFNIMRNLGLGAKHDFIVSTQIFPSRLLGMILLDVEANGEAYYINPGDRKKYYLGRPQDAFNIMNKLGVGITNNDLAQITTGDINRKVEVFFQTSGGLNIPFTSQAPFGNWSDKRQQDGCEEAAALMAVYWARGKSLSREKALEEIIKISDYEKEKYGEFRDASARDTMNRIIKDYLGFYNVHLRVRITKQDIINELDRGRAVIAPVNGRILKNPYYTQPGPPRHMIVISGYDQARDVFITNDPGTRQGEGWEYSGDRLYYAIRDYQTGFHLDIFEINKVMIVVEKE